MCDHFGDTSARSCWVCLEACTAAMTLRWAELIHSDRPAANRLRRIVQLLNRHHDPASNVPRPSASPRYRDQEAEIEGATPPLSAEQRQWQRTAKTLHTIRKRRDASIKSNRGFPSTWALQAKQPEAIRVVPTV